MPPKERQRRPRGEGAVHWSAARERWVASKTVGYDGRGKRIVKTGVGKSESAALRSLRQHVQEYEAGLLLGFERTTVAQAVERWLELARSNVSNSTKSGNEEHYLNHIKPHLGGRKVKDLRTDEVDRWLLKLAPKLSTSTLKQIRSVLNRSITSAVKAGLAERNVVDLSTVPKGRQGRRSRSLTLEQAEAVLTNTRGHKMYAYIVVSLLTGLRPEETRALLWKHVHLDPDGDVPPHIEVWRSVRVGGDTKTPKSRRTLALSDLVVGVLTKHKNDQDAAAAEVGDRWKDHGLVFPSEVGTPQDRHNVLRMFRSALTLVPGIEPQEWTPRDLRHSFVSILSQSGVPIEEISRLMGHSGIAVTEVVYRHELLARL